MLGTVPGIQRICSLCISEILLADLGLGPKVLWGLLNAIQVLSFRTLALGTIEGGRCGGRGGVAMDGAVFLMLCL